MPLHLRSMRPGPNGENLGDSRKLMGLMEGSVSEYEYLKWNGRSDLRGRFAEPSPFPKGENGGSYRSWGRDWQKKRRQRAGKGKREWFRIQTSIVDFKDLSYKLR